MVSKASSVPATMPHRVAVRPTHSHTMLDHGAQEGLRRTTSQVLVKISTF